MTVDDLRQFLREETQTARHEPDRQADKIIRGCKAIAQFLGISERTLGDWKKQGIIGEPVIRQVRKVVTANESDLVAFKPKIKKIKQRW